MCMKRCYLLLVCLCVILSSVSAQKVSEGSLQSLKNCGKVNVLLDFSDACIHGMTVEAFAEYEQDWEVDLPIISRKFVTGLIEKCPNVRFGTDSDTELTLKVKVLSITPKGDYRCEGILMNRQKDKIAYISEVNARGGTFGSKLNLIKDGAEHTGEALGKFIKRTIQKIK